jgi:hypothetical protein
VFMAHTYQGEQCPQEEGITSGKGMTMHPHGYLSRGTVSTRGKESGKGRGRRCTTTGYPEGDEDDQSKGPS